MSEKNPCEGCTKCCEYVALEIDAPEDAGDYDFIRWYLLHNDVWVFIDHDDSWNIQFNTPCEMIKGSKCSYYERRPKICRKYSSENCDKYGDGDSFKILFKTIEDFEKWMAEGKVIPKS